MKESDFRCEASVRFLLNCCDQQVTNVKTSQSTDISVLTSGGVVSGAAS